jgi:DNA polymerase I-like protein with 3'-5' exonuclease and polymerase domains
MSAADMMKTAMCLVRSYIRDNNLRDKVRLKMQVHDQLTTAARQDFSDQWAPILDELMNDAGKLIIPTGILKAETLNSHHVWTK